MNFPLMKHQLTPQLWCSIIIFPDSIAINQAFRIANPSIFQNFLPKLAMSSISLGGASFSFISTFNCQRWYELMVKIPVGIYPFIMFHQLFHIHQLWESTTGTIISRNFWRYQLGCVKSVFWMVKMGVSRNRGTPSHHPFEKRDFPWNKPSSYWGNPNLWKPPISTRL